jgi:hypothetical protein
MLHARAISYGVSHCIDMRHDQTPREKVRSKLVMGGTKKTNFRFPYDKMRRNY